MRRIGVILRGGPMDGWVVTEDAPALRPDWARTIPHHPRGITDILRGRPAQPVWRGRYVVTIDSDVRIAEWQDTGTEVPSVRSIVRGLWLWILIIGTFLALRYASEGGALIGFSIGQVFLEILADMTRFKQTVEQEAAKTADAAAMSMTAKLSAGLTKAGRSLASTGKAMTMSLTAPIVGLGAAIFKVGTDFDTTMRQIVALTDTTSSEIGGVKDAILSLAGEVGKTPQELADGFYFLASAGFNTAEALTVLQTTAKASAAGLGTTADVSRIVGAAINAFGKENLTAVDAVDQLLRAIKDGTAEAPDFANALGQVIPTAAAMGVTFADTVAAMSAMTLKGQDADTAATNLNQTLVSLLKPTAEAEKTLNDLGLSSAGLRQEIKDKGLLATLQTLDKAFGGNEAAIAEVFGNVRALRGVLALLSGDGEQTAHVFDDVAKGALNLADAYAATEGPGRAAGRANAEINKALIKLGDDVLPVVSDMLQKVASAVSTIASAFASLPQPVRSGIVQILALVAALGPVLFITGKITSGVGQLIGVFGKLGRTRVGAGVVAGLRSIAVSAAKVGAQVATSLGTAMAKTGGNIASAIASGLDKVPGSAAIKASIGRVRSFLGTQLGAGLALGVTLVVAKVAVEQVDKNIAGQIEKAITEGNLEGLKNARDNLQRALNAGKIGPVDFADMFGFKDGTKANIAALNEAIAKLEAAAAGPEILDTFDRTGKLSGLSYSQGVGEGMRQGFDAEQAAVDASVKQVFRDTLLSAGEQAKQDARAAGNRAAGAWAQGVHDARQKPLDAYDQLVEMLKHPLSATAEVGRLTGQLFGKKLMEGLHSPDVEIRDWARSTKQSIIDRLNELNVRTGIISKSTAQAVAAGLKSKDPDIRAAAQHVKDIIDGKFDAIPAHAATAGANAGTSFLRALTIKLGNAKIPGLAVQFLNKTIPIFGEGGHLGAGEAAIVGDKGRPELFVPDVAGQVYPDLPAATPNPVPQGPLNLGPFNLYGIGSDVSPAAGRRFAQQIADAAGEALRDQRRRSVP